MKRDAINFGALLADLPAGERLTQVEGVSGCAPSLLISEWLRLHGGPVVFVGASPTIMNQAAEDLGFLQPAAELVTVAGSETSPYSETAPNRDAAMRRMAGLSQLATDRPWDVLFTDAAGLIRKVVPNSVVKRATFRIVKEEPLDTGALTRALTASGYLRVPVVEDPGSFAVRGGLIDVWGPLQAEPVRVDLFGDEVVSIKRFDADSQRTSVEHAELWLAPTREMLLLDDVRERAAQHIRQLCDAVNTPSLKTRQYVSEVLDGRLGLGTAGLLPACYDLQPLWESIPSNATVMIEDPASVIGEIQAQLERASDEESRDTSRPRYPVDAFYLLEGSLAEQLKARRTVSLAGAFVRGTPGSELDEFAVASGEPRRVQTSDLSELRRAVAAARSTRGKRAVLDPLIESLQSWHEQALNVTCVARTVTQARRLCSLLSHRGVRVVADTERIGNVEVEAPDDQEAERYGEVRVTVGSLQRGVIAPFEHRVLVTEEEIFGQRAHLSEGRRGRRGRAALEDLRALQPGDYVVHTEHGVGRYVGLENRSLPGNVQIELLVVEYAAGKLFLPVYRLNQIQKYSGADRPKLDRLGGQSFAKAKAKAKRKAREMADELLRLYADRHAAVRDPLPPPDDDYAAFEAAFPFEETTEQAGAIADVMDDLQKSQVMDRLVCGDVGFGKTEVALRAAFRAASVGRQVAVLCPTTVLAQQHFLTFSRRLADTPFEVRTLSRFVSAKDAADTLARLRDGTVDIVVGTHRVLSKDVQFKDLGLLVVDEEQRFGVVHKERMKQLRTSIDVLTLTATPIPRTLQLAIGGLREMSIISTPPVDRRAIRTVIARSEDAVIQEAIDRELSRGGQVFYVYNRIEGLSERAERLQRLVPNAKIAIGHGQMREATLERTMLDFVNGDYDILVSTAIVESGLDIPRANTMLIDRADTFGLAQLYQLRGRVGRSRERAYCYLLVPPADAMSDDGRSRVEALERYSELGSGFQIATLDMELRGTGDLLGAEQSGTVAGVGLELFCRMLEEATAELRGQEVVHDIDPDLHFDVEGLIPQDYIDEVGVRLSMYKRLSGAHDEAEVMQLAAEMEDRFGPAPQAAVRLVELMRLKVELRRLRVLVCEATSTAVSLRFADDTPLDVAKLAGLVAEQRAKFRLSPDGRLTRRLKDGERAADSLALADKMLDELRRVLDSRS